MRGVTDYSKHNSVINPLKPNDMEKVTQDIANIIIKEFCKSNPQGNLWTGVFNVNVFEMQKFIAEKLEVHGKYDNEQLQAENKRLREALEKFLSSYTPGSFTDYDGGSDWDTWSEATEPLKQALGKG